MGDFNAHPQSRFGSELVKFCDEFGYSVGDLRGLPGDTYTWVNDATGLVRWLDHVICPESFYPSLQQFHITHDLIESDHHALCLTVTSIQQPPAGYLSPSSGINYFIHNKNDYCSKTERG